MFNSNGTVCTPIQVYLERELDELDTLANELLSEEGYNDTVHETMLQWHRTASMLRDLTGIDPRK